MHSYPADWGQMAWGMYRHNFNDFFLKIIYNIPAYMSGTCDRSVFTQRIYF